jgi:phage baseplate assembly protein W
MQSLKLVNGDIIFERGELVLIDSKDEVSQCAEVILSTNKGEWFLDPDFGIDFSILLAKNPNEDEIKDELRSGLFQDPRIKTVDDITLQFNRTDRTLAISFIATGTDGENIVREVNIDA